MLGIRVQCYISSATAGTMHVLKEHALYLQWHQEMQLLWFWHDWPRSNGRAQRNDSDGVFIYTYLFKCMKWVQNCFARTPFTRNWMKDVFGEPWYLVLSICISQSLCHKQALSCVGCAMCWTSVVCKIVNLISTVTRNCFRRDLAQVVTKMVPGLPEPNYTKTPIWSTSQTPLCLYLHFSRIQPICWTATHGWFYCGTCHFRLMLHGFIYEAAMSIYWKKSSFRIRAVSSGLETECPIVLESVNIS